MRPTNRAIPHGPSLAPYRPDCSRVREETGIKPLDQNSCDHPASGDVRRILYGNNPSERSALRTTSDRALERPRTLRPSCLTRGFFVLMYPSNLPLISDLSGDFCTPYEQ